MTRQFLTLILAVTVLAGCAPSSETEKTDTVNVASAIENPTKITTSQLGKTIRFVPLETTDSSLVANNWSIAFTNNRAIVTNYGSNSEVLVFDLNDGRFLNRVGQLGHGPEDFSNPFFLLDPVTSQMVFMANNGNGFITYSPDGEFLGKIPGVNRNSGVPIGIADSVIYTALPSTTTRELAIKALSTNSHPIYSFIAFQGQTGGYFPNGFSGQTDYKDFYGPLRHSQQNLSQVTNQGKTFVIKGFVPTTSGNYAGFKESVCDTVYRLTPSALVPELVFNMGKHGFSVNDINIKDIKSDNLIVTDVTVTPTKAVFGVSRGWIGDDNHSLFIGTYDRATGKTLITTAEEGIVDDLGGFIPFAPAFSNPKGDLIGVLTTDDIEEWYSAHPDFPRPNWLNELPAEANPILVILTD